jgi:secondary thiamine-phosphate synthase enzyme
VQGGELSLRGLVAGLFVAVATSRLILRLELNMTHYSKIFSFGTQDKHQVIDITRNVTEALRDSGVSEGQLTIFTPHATAAIAINENDNLHIGSDLLRALAKLVVEDDGWSHDCVNDNATAHIKGAIVGPSETVPVIDGGLCLGNWQNVFFCEFDGPRHERKVVVSIVS